jgi:hypothetical protein
VPPCIAWQLAIVSDSSVTRAVWNLNMNAGPLCVDSTAAAVLALTGRQRSVGIGPSLLAVHESHKSAAVAERGAVRWLDRTTLSGTECAP